ncbi:EamA family transporter [Oceanobacillus sp. M65]|uniref:EamA family transporter n=1 Tax=Oceanobacillus jordanicus TaxID=2867266 RepID=A0AAW5B4C4_9BACI|nr:EamA family transporter [Oceanobacillus jordanicus]MCG3418009.1 EamA family transporter [Oceanobacillus jordanicus]
MNYILLVINILLLVSGQMLWKTGMAHLSPVGLHTILHVVKSPYIIGGGLIYVLATGIWLYLLTRMPFSIAYPFQSLAYVLGIFIGFALFKETVTPIQWAGAAVIVFGVYLIAR